MNLTVKMAAMWINVNLYSSAITHPDWAPNPSDAFQSVESTDRQIGWMSRQKKGRTLSHLCKPDELEFVRRVTCLCQLCNISLRAHQSTTQEVKLGVSELVLWCESGLRGIVMNGDAEFLSDILMGWLTFLWLCVQYIYFLAEMCLALCAVWQTFIVCSLD